MIPYAREKFNKEFTAEKYKAFLEALDKHAPGAIEFRVAETPVFIPKDFTTNMLQACESIVDVIVDPSFKSMTRHATPEHLRVPGENEYSHFIAFDFGICINEEGKYEPQLIEMQGFPSLFAYEILLDDTCRKHFDIPPGFSAYLGGYNKESYIALLKEIILGTHPPENVILLEILPHQQKTRVDFYCTQEYTGIQPVCITELEKEGRKLYYNREGIKTEVKRIYNRVIFDDLFHQPPAIQEKGKLFFEELDVEWVPHPTWFYRISKYTLPMVRHPYIPETFFLHEIKQLPGNLEDYVLKPLFSFAGQGVVIDVKPQDIENVKDPQNWILQRKVRYAEVISTPSEPAKAEIRIFYFWKEGEARPVPANNLARLSKGKMIGVRYNKDKEWVGGTYCLFEE
jgi:hypothetical protein